MRSNELLERIRQQVPAPSPAFERLRRRRDRKRRTARLAAGSVALLVAIAGVGVAVVALRPSSTGDPTDVFDYDFADGARSIAQPGEFYYTDVLRWNQGDVGTSTALEGPTRTQIWISPIGSGSLLYDDGSGGRQDRSRIDAEEEIAAVAGLSDDPNVLYQQLVERSSPGGASPNPIATTSPGRSQLDTSLLRGVRDLLEPGLLTPAQQAAIPGAVARIDGVTVDLGATDPLGREAVRVIHVIDYGQRDGSRVEWYFDTGTGQFLGELWVDIRDERVDSASIVAAAGIAASDHEPPTGPALSIPVSDVTPAFAP
jgi:hypothetical protein